MHTDDNHLQAAFRSLQHLFTQDADLFTNVDRSLSYDLVEELSERHEAARLRGVSGKKGKRSTSKGDRSNFEGDRSNSQRDRGKNERVVAA